MLIVNLQSDQSNRAESEALYPKDSLGNGRLSQKGFKYDNCLSFRGKYSN